MTKTAKEGADLLVQAFTEDKPKSKKAKNKTKTATAKGNKMKNQKIKTAVTVAITLAVVGAVTLVALTAYNKGVKTGEANERKLQSTIQEAVKAQVSKQ